MVTTDQLNLDDYYQIIIFLAPYHFGL